MTEYDLIKELLTRFSKLQLEFTDEFITLCPNINFPQLLVNAPILLFLGNCVVSNIPFDDAMKLLMKIDTMKRNYEHIKKGLVKQNELYNN